MSIREGFLWMVSLRLLSSVAAGGAAHRRVCIGGVVGTASVVSIPPLRTLYIRHVVMMIAHRVPSSFPDHVLVSGAQVQPQQQDGGASHRGHRHQHLQTGRQEVQVPGVTPDRRCEWAV